MQTCLSPSAITAKQQKSQEIFPVTKRYPRTRGNEHYEVFLLMPA